MIKKNYNDDYNTYYLSKELVSSMIVNFAFKQKKRLSSLKGSEPLPDICEDATLPLELRTAKEIEAVADGGQGVAAPRTLTGLRIPRLKPSPGDDVIKLCHILPTNCNTWTQSL